MNDRFRFRVWFKPNYEEPKMLYDAEQTYDYMYGEPESILAESFGEVLEDKDFIVMQCTGLKDKNGKLIYEGDIIKCSYGFEYYIGVVVWDKQCIQFSMSVDKELYSFNQRSEYDKIEVIGNICENKELLNE